MLTLRLHYILISLSCAPALVWCYSHKILMAAVDGMLESI